jgi:trypsin
MQRRFMIAALLASVLLLVPTSAALGVVGGNLDGNAHPNVAMIVFYQPDGRFRCSATLASPTVLITAAHCTAGVRGKTIVTFDSVAPATTPRAADDTGDGQSQTGYTTTPAGWLTGTPHAHPLWADKLQLNNLHDVGVVVLDQPYTLATPAHLPPAGYLDTLTRGQNGNGLSDQVFTIVGYGVFFEKPDGGPQKPTAVSDRTRRNTTAVGQTLTSQVIKLAENAKDSRAGGGSCFGDSGGPLFHGGYIVGDTSFGASIFCQGMGGYYRLDTADARSFLDDYLAVP